MIRCMAKILVFVVVASHIVVLSGCPGSKTEKCSWGAVCPPGEVCHESTEQCVLPGQISSCKDKDDYDPCSYTGSPPGTVCRQGICILPGCGDSVVDPGEDCDGENLEGSTCESLGLGEGTLGCNADCTFDTTGCEHGSVCGNNVREGEELCDGEDLAGETCRTQGFYAGSLSCFEDCSGFDTSLCTGYCGDETINGDEICDGSNLGGQTCESLGYHEGGDLACLEDCSGFDTSGCLGGYCGDGIINGDEICDGLDLAGQTCESVDSIYHGGTLACRLDCTEFDVSDCEYCGDGTVNGDEMCDGENLGGNTCVDLGFDSGTLACGEDCVFDTVGCGTCGDGTVNGHEVCDGIDLLGETCQSLGFQGGHPACLDDCSGFDTTACWQWISISNSGLFHTCGIRSDNTAWCWGNNEYGQLGNGESGPDQFANTPVQVLELSNVTAISGGNGHTCALAGNGTAWCWGNNEYGQLGNGESGEDEMETSPVQVQNLNNLISISARMDHTCAAKNDGTAWCWGLNSSGQLGDGTTEDKHTPVQVATIDDVALVSSGGTHTCAAKNDGTVWCWGLNSSGQLGDGTTEDKHTPVQVATNDNVASISSGGAHTCAVKNDGTAWCWGSNYHGQLGNGKWGKMELVNPPVEVSNLTDVVSIFAGRYHTCAVESDSKAWCWGINRWGQLGNGQSGFMADSSVPVEVLGLTSTSMMSGGENHTCAVTSEGTAWCWGRNTRGQLGDGTDSNSSTPVMVSSE